MLFELAEHARLYLYDVFVARFDIWLAFGLLAQGLFTARFLVQWLASEKAGRSVVPVAFWYLSLLGGSMTLIYGLQRRDAIIIIGQVFAIFIYIRNLMLIYKQRQAESEIT